jgi:8-oxo-dGTP pyrophosphatase MutT (NUDIX family)
VSGYRHGDDLRDRITANLAGFRAVALEGDFRRAAVAITVVAMPDGEAGYLFMRRGLGLRSNAGQYALPGGRLDPGEDAVAAARRELHEELGIVAHPESVLGVLDDMPTRTGGSITPVVLWVAGPITIVPHLEEVHEAWINPLAELDHPEAPKRVDDEWGTGTLRMPMRGEWINPPTAAILYQFRDAALHARTVRVAHEQAPDWTAH